MELYILSIVGILRDNNTGSHIFRFDKVNEEEICVLHIGINNMDHAGFTVLTAVVMKSSILWDISPISPLKNNRRFGETYLLYIQGSRMSHAKNSKVCYLLHAGFLLGLFFDPEDGSDIFLQRTTRRYIPDDRIF
jgi:hypothetical protein